MTLSKENLRVIEGFRDSAPVGSSFTQVSRGVWQGGRLFVDEWGNEVFLPIGTERKLLKKPRLTFVGDAIQNVKGWEKETIVTNGAES